MLVRSIRLRIAQWYIAIFAPFLALLALTAYWFLAYTSQERVDEFLAESAATVAATIEFERKEGAADTVATERVVAALRLPDIAVTVIDEASGRALSSYEGARIRRTGMRPLERQIAAALARAASAAPRDPALVTLHAVGQDVRVLTLPYAISKRRLIIGVAQLMTARTLMLRDARLAIGVGLPLVMVIASVGGWWLAGKGLSPVDDMSRQAQRIGATNLHQRLPVANPGDELGRLATVFNGLLARLETTFEAQARFAADASHELRTPVAVISGEAEFALARDDRPREELQDALRIIGDQSQRLRAIVDDLFFLARADSGESMLRPTPLYLHDLLEDSVRAVRSLAVARGVTVQLTGTEEAPIIGDEGLLRRAISNLLVNAIKYSRPNGEVTLQLADDGPAWRVDVSDTGPGIADEARVRLFERFFRTDEARATESVDGAGLGLAITRWIVRAHDGDALLAESSPDGSTFRVLIPKATHTPLSPVPG
ncbi:MAG: ATP-binding protein [Gemmatimonadota bacterium]